MWKCSTIFIGALTCQVLLWGHLNGLFCLISPYFAPLKRWSTNRRWFEGLLFVLILTHTQTLYVICFFIQAKKFNRPLSQKWFDFIKKQTEVLLWYEGDRDREKKWNNNPGKVFGLLVCSALAIHRCTLQHADLLFYNSNKMFQQNNNSFLSVGWCNTAIKKAHHINLRGDKSDKCIIISLLFVCCCCFFLE